MNKNFWESRIRPLFLVLGPGVFMFFHLIDSGSFESRSYSVLGLSLWMFFWWVGEVIPLAATALLPLVVFPILRIMTFKETAALFASDVIFLFLGGFFLSRAVEKWNLHAWASARLLHKIKGGHRTLLLITLMMTGFLSMWMSNTAACLIMLPLVSSILARQKTPSKEFEKAIMLGVAYSASVGGFGTPIGSPPNALLFSHIQKHFPELNFTFLDWMIIALPLSILGILVLWAFLGFRLPKESSGARIPVLLSHDIPDFNVPMKRVLYVFSFMVIAWIFLPLAGQKNLSDSWIAIVGSILLFLVPANKNFSSERLLSAKDIDNQPWNILLLFGGGLALAEGFEKSGFLPVFSRALTDFGFQSGFFSVLVLTGSLILLTEIASNTALAALFVPLAGAFAEAFKLPGLSIPFVIAAAVSMSFMLPMATPPNAIVFSRGHLTIRQMMKSGSVLNLLFALLISIFCWTYVQKFW